MFKTEKVKEMLKEFNSDKNEEVQKETLIQEGIDYFKKSHIVHNQQDILVYLGMIIIPLGFGLMVGFSIYNHDIKQGLILSSIMAIIFFIMGIQMFISSKIDSVNKFKKNFKQLFMNLSDKPYEIRIENTDDKNKYKVIIEENVMLCDDHVIKEKSRHITGYINNKATGESIIKVILSFVEKAEKTFI